MQWFLYWKMGTCDGKKDQPEEAVIQDRGVWGKGEEAAAIGNVIPESDLFSHCSIHFSSERSVFAQYLEMENTLISPKLSCV